MVSCMPQLLYTRGKEPLEVACVPELVWMVLQRETSLVLAIIEP